MDGNDEIAARDTKPKSFASLVEDLSDVLTPTSGVSFEELDPSGVMDLMNAYKSQESEWEKYAFEDSNKIFTRNLIDRGNGKSNLVRSGVVRCLGIVSVVNRRSSIDSYFWCGLQAKKHRFMITPIRTV